MCESSLLQLCVCRSYLSVVEGVVASVHVEVAGVVVVVLCMLSCE